MNQPDPFALFAEVFAQAAETGIVEPNSMALATATPDGRPSLRIVLLKGYDHRGFTFYTNLESRKARELEANPHAALCFHWKSINKQVRIEGRVEAVSDEEADAYFASRARGSQIGAWASRQSHRLENREQLLQSVRQTEERFADADVPRPPFWSGFRVVPDRIEFWTMGEYRLHERLTFERGEDGAWVSMLLYP